MTVKLDVSAVSFVADKSARVPLVSAFADNLYLSGHATGEIKRLRPLLASACRQLFKAPLTTADAAAALYEEAKTAGVEDADCFILSTRDMDEAGKAIVQRVRVTLSRALKDAGLLKINPKKGRKPQAAGAKDGDEADETVEAVKAAKGKKELVEVMLSNLSNLSDAGLERLMNGIVAERASRSAAPAPARKVKKA